jgi:predicted site-specific integrase-resolvase
MSSDNYFNATQAAKHTGVNVVTIRDYLAKGKLPNAKQVPKGKVKVWQIPLTDLAAAGLLDKVSSASEAQTVEVRSTALESQISELQARLTLTEQLLARADQELEGYRQRERQLFATLETRATQEQRRRWWFGRNK